MQYQTEGTDIALATRTLSVRWRKCAYACTEREFPRTQENHMVGVAELLNPPSED